ncbi:MAG TPA: hypothetical protein VHC45_11810 [Gaiellaceae bacterium]|jgi:hypothetical protein|nr:hypothetical protein [Gaiellaceae bacterium]
MTRVSTFAPGLGAAALLVWLLAVAGAFSLSYAMTWVVLGVGVGLLAAARLARVQRPR